MSHEPGVATIGLVLQPSRAWTGRSGRSPAARLPGRRRSRIKLSLLDLPLRRDQLLELIPAELREKAEFSARRAAGGRPG